MTITSDRRTRIGVPEPLCFAGFAVFAGCFALCADPLPHRVWGVVAAAGYTAAAIVALVDRTAGRVCALAGAALLPLAVLLAAGSAQEEVGVVARSGLRLLRHGTPYLATPSGYTSYDPYLPGMALFGMSGLDPRLLFAGVFAGTITLTVEVYDDGVGGADPAAGTGLTGLADRVAVHGGSVAVSSPPGGPTIIRVEIPCG